MDLTTSSFSIADLRSRTPRNAFWYVGTPYSKYRYGLNAAFSSASEIAALFIRDGVPVFAPISHSHPIAVHGAIDPLDHSIWLPADTPMMHAAHGLIVAQLEGWQDSYGIKAEVAEFQLQGKPILMFDPATTELCAHVAD